MNAIEKQAIEDLKAEVRGRIQTAFSDSWEKRKGIANELLIEATGCWWKVHQLDPTAYERDLETLNSLAGWNGLHRQIGYWESTIGKRLLMPPKFFGGDTLALHESFIASMSLNHAILSPASSPFQQELSEQQSHLDAYSAHSQYFLRPYAYRKFFQPRAEVLHAYANKLGIQSIPERSKWPIINHFLSFYIEAFPTRSYKFAMPKQIAGPSLIESEVFVCAINSIIHQIVVSLLRPKCVLLAGQATWTLWPDANCDPLGREVGRSVRTDGTCKIFLNSVQSAVHGGNTTVVRTNFLRTVYGPNSTEELRRLGANVLATNLS